MKIGYNKKFSSEIEYYDGNVYLKSDENPVAIDIKYKGLIYVECELPQGFAISENKGRILIVRISDTETPNLLFKYFGSFQIESVKVYSKNGGSRSSVSTNLHYWVQLDKNWSTFSSNWQEYLDQYFSGSSIDNLSEKMWTNLRNTGKSIVRHTTFGSNVEGVYLNGEKYTGEVIYDSRGFYTTRD